MATRVTFRCEGPPAFRVAVAGGDGRCALPARADYACALPDEQNPRWAWAYGRGEAEYDLPAGRYVCALSAGPCRAAEVFPLAVDGAGSRTVNGSLGRIFNPAAEGWLCGDGHLHTWRGARADDFPTLFEAEDIDFAGIQYWGLYTGSEHIETPPGAGCFRLGRAWATVDEEVEMHSPWGPWEDSTVVGLTERLPDLRAGFGYRMNADFYGAARRQEHRMIVYQSPAWAQLPVDALLGLADGVNLCDNYFSVTAGPQRTAPGNPPGQIALDVWRHYDRLLNAGLRLPVSGGSAYPRGGGGGPAGMSRFYVHTGGDNSPDAYFAAWKAGRTFATNGPLLLADVDGAVPGEAPGIGAASRLRARVVSNRPVRSVEWVADGRVLDRKTFTGPAPQDETWTCEHDLRPFQWVAARCLGDSERALGCPVSPPLLAAHTSPIYLRPFAAGDAVYDKARAQLRDHIGWMGQVMEGEAPPPPQAVNPAGLDAAEKARIREVLGAAERLL